MGKLKPELVTVELPVIRCPTCDTPWVLRWAIFLGGKPPGYVYQRDCRHKSRPPIDDGADEWARAGIARAVSDG